jgi:hypothetical protein
MRGFHYGQLTLHSGRGSLLDVLYKRTFNEFNAKTDLGLLTAFSSYRESERPVGDIAVVDVLIRRHHRG